VLGRLHGARFKIIAAALNDAVADFKHHFLEEQAQVTAGAEI
jgi:hypothetical protein